jgi:hypothetical protein
VGGSGEEDVENLGVPPASPEAPQGLEASPTAPDTEGDARQAADESASTGCASDEGNTEALRTVVCREDSGAKVDQEVAAAPAVARQSLADVLRVGSPVREPFRQTIGILVVSATPQIVRRGQVMPLKLTRTILGRGPKASCLLDDSHVDDYHAVINQEVRPQGAGFYVYAVEGSTLCVNDSPLESSQRLNNGDRLLVGRTELIFLEVGLKEAV